GTPDPTDPGTPDPTEPGTPDPSEDPSTDPTLPGDGTGPDGGTGDDVNTNPDSAGQQPVAQGKAKEELAETGAAETTFLLIGAATMIAGGIGFRLLPRLVGGRD
ncbi:hypothetical protein ADL35_25205, partial [Streptomyces sp. NRRL WC-3753]